MSQSYRWSRSPVPPQRWVMHERGHVAIDHEFARGLLGSVNHHLRTPLTVVLGHAELLVDREDELPAEVRQSLACLLRAAQRLDEVVIGVCELMDIACVGLGPMASVDISELVAEEVATYRKRAAQRGVRIQVCGEPEQRCLVDPRRLRRAVRELLDNALTCAPEQSMVQVVSTTSATRIRIAVSDQGVDVVDGERRARPFVRGAHPHQSPAGRGMGLALASAVAAWHGGRLVLSKGFGRGVQACIELPTTPCT